MVFEMLLIKKVFIPFAEGPKIEMHPLMGHITFYAEVGTGPKTWNQIYVNLDFKLNDEALFFG